MLKRLKDWFQRTRSYVDEVEIGPSLSITGSFETVNLNDYIKTIDDPSELSEGCVVIDSSYQLYILKCQISDDEWLMSRTDEDWEEEGDIKISTESLMSDYRIYTEGGSL